MRFIFTSQGTSGSGSLARSLNLVSNIFSVHGHFPVDKHLNIDYKNDDLSHLLGHSMKGIYERDINTIFEFLEDCVPEKEHHGLVHTFTLGSLENKLKEINFNQKINNVAVANIVRDPEKVYLSSRALINKSLRFSRYGKKEYLDNYQNLISTNPLLLPILNQIEILELKNPYSSIEILIAANTVALMFNEAGNTNNLIKSYKIEEILENKEAFHQFLSQTINYKEPVDKIPEEITKKVNLHRKSKSVYKLTEIEKVLIDYFLNENGVKIMNTLYPENYINNPNLKEKQIFHSKNIKKVDSNKEMFRNMRENLILNSLFDKDGKNFDFIQEKLARSIASIDQILLSFEDNKNVSNLNWSSNIKFISEDKKINANIIAINNQRYIVPQNLGEINPNDFITEKIFLERYPSIKKVNSLKSKFKNKFLNKIKLFKKKLINYIN